MRKYFTKNGKQVDYNYNEIPQAAVKAIYAEMEVGEFQALIRRVNKYPEEVWEDGRGCVVMMKEKGSCFELVLAEK